MSSSYRYNKSFEKKDKYYISPMKTVIEESEEKKSQKNPRNINYFSYIKTYSNLGSKNLSNKILSKNEKIEPKNIFKNKSYKLPLLIDKKAISTFYKMKQYKVSLPKHREKKEINEKENEQKINNLLERFASTSYKKNHHVNKNEEKKYDFNSYLQLQSKAEVRFRPRYGDNSLDLVNYINKVANIRKNVVKDILDEIRGTENRFNVEKPEDDSNFKSKNKNLIDNRWKNSFSLEEYQQFFMKNLKGKISSMNYRKMLKKFRQISLMCFSEGNNNYSSIKRLDYVD